jgi:hypothetical protein
VAAHPVPFRTTPGAHRPAAYREDPRLRRLGNDPDHLSSPYPAELWDPATGERKTLDQPLGGDLFCAGHTFLSDGRLLVAGGTHRYDRKIAGLTVVPFTGLEQAYLFDPVTETWTCAPDMLHGRWYPILVQLADGRTLAMAGFSKGFPWILPAVHPERWDPSIAKFIRLG